ncbi:MAG: efflux RND transporter periplasmic adaptor subunit [Opitutales bacterium]|nr:efflux RND transporter periplasmic adaptor subunit [Opitutales bacterium]
MKKILLPILILLGCFVLMFGLFTLRKKPERVPQAEQIASVEIADVHAADDSINIYVQGTVSPRTATNLLPQVSGTIKSVAPVFYVGGFFRKGDILLQIDPTDYEVALANAQSVLAQAELALAQEEAQSVQAKKDWDALQLEGEPSALTLRLPQLKKAQATVNAATAALKQAQRDLHDTRVVAPYDGMVQTKNADLGQYVSSSTVLGSIFAVDFAEIRLPVKTSDLAFIDFPKGMRGDASEWPEVTLEAEFAGNHIVRNARIVRSEGVVDTSSRFTYLVAQLEDPYGIYSGELLSPMPVGLFVNATVKGKVFRNLVTIPRYALRGADTVLVVNKESRINVRHVKLLKTDVAHAYIAEGISDGEQICLTALEFVIEGMKVQDINAQLPMNTPAEEE